MRASLLVFAFLGCLYALTGGGQGYSVDGLFGYQVARSVATDPQQEFLNRNRGTLARWGPVVPALGVPFTWAGARLAQIAPFRESVPLDGSVARLSDWPALGAAGDEGARTELRLPLSPPRAVDDVRLVYFLSLATSLEQGAPVAEVLVVGEGGNLGRGVLRAGVESAEWSLDVAPGGGARHGAAPLAGHWPGNPEANLYLGRVSLETPGGAPGAGPSGGLGREVVFRYLAPAGRLHLRAVLTAPPPGQPTRLPAPRHPPGGDGPALPIAGPSSWSEEQQEALFTRFGYSFLNGLLMAATAALLVPLAGLLGYGRRVGIAVALVFGVATPAWPYARYDFAEPGAGLFMLGATALIFGAAGRGWGRGWWAMAMLAGAGVLASLAAGAKYTAAWCLPLLAVQVLLLWGRRDWRRSVVAVTAFLAPAVLGGAVVLLLAGRAPSLWTGWRQGIASGWLDFAVTDGLYGLLVSPGKGLFLYAPPLLLAVAGLPFFIRRTGWRAF
ncbi:MAG TPA: hypothetical protein VHQ00_07895, partial [Chloroflexota bacterium]|nr:hypothetical protein [Chloroflexota bacterium]